MDLPRNRMADYRQLQTHDECEICGNWEFVIQCRVNRWQITLCAECSKEQRRLLDVWDWLQENGE